MADEILVQVSYAIGVADPMGIYVNTYDRSKVNLTDGEIAERISKIFDLRPYAIEQRLKLRSPIYSDTAAYGHMGREPEIKKLKFKNTNGEEVVHEVETFTWEKLDYVDSIKEVFKGSFK